MTPDQVALLGKARQSLDAAKLLADQGYHDFAVSRAYYAMFYVAEALLLGEGLSFSRHSAVIASFGKEFSKTGRVPSEFHRYLIEAHGSRNVGDYDIRTRMPATEADKQIDRARMFLELGERFLSA